MYLHKGMAKLNKTYRSDILYVNYATSKEDWPRADIEKEKIDDTARHTAFEIDVDV